MLCNLSIFAQTLCIWLIRPINSMIQNERPSVLISLVLKVIRGVFWRVILKQATVDLKGDGPWNQISLIWSEGSNHLKNKVPLLLWTLVNQMCDKLFLWKYEEIAGKCSRNANDDSTIEWTLSDPCCVHVFCSGNWFERL